MLTNLFSMFDPTLYSFNPFMLMFLSAMVIGAKKSKKLISMSKMSILFLNFYKVLFKEFMGQANMMKNIKKNIKYNGNMKTIIMMFMFIFFMNFSSLFPFIFSTTSHMSVNFTMTFVLWSMSVLIALNNNYKNFLSHMTPSGTPIMLMSFMVIIETISNVIRPLTLAVRLMANMVAGHLLLSLLSKFSTMSSTNTLTAGSFFMVLGILEMGVSLIQAYVMTLLFILYLKEAF